MEYSQSLQYVAKAMQEKTNEGLKATQALYQYYLT
jgi:hypothetical protein